MVRFKRNNQTCTQHVLGELLVEKVMKQAVQTTVEPSNLYSSGIRKDTMVTGTEDMRDMTTNQSYPLKFAPMVVKLQIT